MSEKNSGINSGLQRRLTFQANTQGEDGKVCQSDTNSTRRNARGPESSFKSTFITFDNLL